jgi:hypothetical protein
MGNSHRKMTVACGISICLAKGSHCNWNSIDQWF